MIDLKTIAVARKLIGSPTDEQVGEAVDNFLTEHPVQPYDDSEIKEDLSAIKSDTASILCMLTDEFGSQKKKEYWAAPVMEVAE